MSISDNKGVRIPKTAEGMVSPTIPLQKQFQIYTSMEESVTYITKTGKKASTVNFQLITADKEIIEYLNEEIELGLPGITKGRLVNEDEIEPMAVLKRKIIAEYLAEKTKKDEASQEELNKYTTGIMSTNGVLSGASASGI